MLFLVNSSDYGMQDCWFLSLFLCLLLFLCLFQLLLIRHLLLKILFRSPHIFIFSLILQDFFLRGPTKYVWVKPHLSDDYRFEVLLIVVPDLQIFIIKVETLGRVDFPTQILCNFHQIANEPFLPLLKILHIFLIFKDKYFELRIFLRLISFPRMTF